MKRLIAAFVLLVVGALAGCSAFQPTNQTLNITCTVPDTTVKVNGDRFDCPAKIDVRRDSKVLIEASKKGFDSYSKQIDYHLSSSAKWDAVGTVCWFFPVFGLMTPGAWDLDETNIVVSLMPLQ